MCPRLIEIESKTAEKKLCTNKQTDRQTNKQTNRHYENNGHLAVNQKKKEEEETTGRKYNVRICYAGRP